jgi:ribosomal protein S18 acetylase RimI-like enzyme
MNQIRIKQLEVLQPEDIHRLNVGYTSRAMYAVCKTEAGQKTTISLERVDLEKPFVKHWETDEEELARLQAAVLEGFSWAAYDGELVVALVIAEPRHWNRSLWVWELHVAETHRRLVIGQRLLEILADCARQAGFRVVVCETQNTNAGAIAFYQQVGFEIEGIDVSYYSNADKTGGEVAIFMKRKLE